MQRDDLALHAGGDSGDGSLYESRRGPSLTILQQNLIIDRIKPMNRENLSRTGILLLTSLLFFYLSAAPQFQVFLDLSETIEHLLTEADGESGNLIRVTDLTHDCHSCLTSHPKVSVSSAVSSSLPLGLEQNSRGHISKTVLTLSEPLKDTKSRSPPA